MRGVWILVAALAFALSPPAAGDRGDDDPHGKESSTHEAARDDPREGDAREDDPSHSKKHRDDEKDRDRDHDQGRREGRDRTPTPPSLPAESTPPPLADPSVPAHPGPGLEAPGQDNSWEEAPPTPGPPATDGQANAGADASGPRPAGAGAAQGAGSHTSGGGASDRSSHDAVEPPPTQGSDPSLLGGAMPDGPVFGVVPGNDDGSFEGARDAPALVLPDRSVWSPGGLLTGLVVLGALGGVVAGGSILGVHTLRTRTHASPKGLSPAHVSWSVPVRPPGGLGERLRPGPEASTPPPSPPTLGQLAHRVRQNPMDGEAHFLLGAELFARGEPERGARHLERGIRLLPHAVLVLLEDPRYRALLRDEEVRRVLRRFHRDHQRRLWTGYA